MNIVAEQKIFDEANLSIPVEIKEEEFEDEIKTEVVKPVSEELEYNYELQDIDCDPLKFENKEVNDPNGEEPLDCRDEIELEYNDGILLLENKEELVVEFEDQAVSGVQQDIQIVNGNHEINRKTELRLVKEVELGNENGKTQIHQEETFFPDEIQLYIKEDLNEADLIIEDWQGSNSNLGQKHSKPSKDDSQREQSMFEEPNGSFESAKEKEKAAEDTSNLDFSSCESAKEPKRKRKNRVFRLPGEETKLDDDDHSVPSPVFISTPKLKASPSYPDPTKYFKQLLKSNNTDQLLVFPMLIDYTSTQPLPIPSESEPSPSQLLITNRLSPVSIDLVTCTNTPIPPCHNSQTITPQLPGTSQRTGDRRLSMNQRLMWEVIEDHGRRLTGIEQKLDQIIDVLTRGNENPCPIEEQPTFQVYKMLPIKEEEDLNEFEKQISTSPRVRQKLIKVLGCVSGKTVRTLACKVMRKLMSDGFAETFSLTGKQITGGIKKKTFDGTHTYQIVVDVCFWRFKDCKNCTVREAVSEWLVQAKFRRKGREERLAKLMQTEDGDTH